MPSYSHLDLSPAGLSHLTVADLMTPNPVALQEGDKLSEAMHLMQTRNIQHFPVVRDKKLVRLVSERHIRDAMPSILTLRDPEARTKAISVTRVDQVGIPNPESIAPTSTLLEAVATMRRLRADSLPVVKEGELVGILTAGDLVSLLEKVLQHAGRTP